MDPAHASFSCDDFDVFSCFGFCDLPWLLGENIGCVRLVSVVLHVVHEAGMLGSVEYVVFDGDDSCFLSFSSYNKFVFVPVDIIEFEVAEFADAHAGVREKVDDGFRSFSGSASVTAAKNEVDVLCCWGLDGFFVGFVRGERVGDVAELAPGIEGFDIMIELEPFCSVFYTFGEVVIGLFRIEVEEIYTVFFEMDEFSYSVPYRCLRIIV